MPIPKRTSSHGTAPSGKPDTSVSVNAMYVKAPNRPPKPKTVIAIDAHTWPLANAPTSARRSAPSGRRSAARGSRSASAASATTPIAVMAQNVARHPSCWPSRVPSGTPSTLATVSPVNIVAIAIGSVERVGAVAVMARATIPRLQLSACASYLRRP